MKKNIAKLMVLTIIMVMPAFIMTAIVMADPPGLRSLRGQYAATGIWTCLVAPLGFNNGLIPNPAPDGSVPSMVMTGSMEGVFTFYRDGTGHAERPNSPGIILSSTLGLPVPSAVGSMDSWEFEYEVKRDGSITLMQVPGSHSGEFNAGPLNGFKFKNDNRNWYGMISPDGKTITLNGGLPDIITSPGSDEGLICNSSATLTWLSNR